MTYKGIKDARWNRRKGKRRTLGVVMIVKNEAQNLPDLFRTIASVADEVVVVDTGSTDGTVAICEHWGVKVVVDPWRDDFSRARNRSIEEATAKYLMWLDADDRLPNRTQDGLRRLRDKLLSEVDDRAFALLVQNSNASGDSYPFRQVRLFPRRSGVRFKHPIHEQLSPSLAACGIPVVPVELVVEHTGYQDAGVVQAKLQRNVVLLRAALEQEPEDIGLLIHMAQTLKDMQQFGEAERLLSAALEQMSAPASPPRLIAETFVLRCHCRLQLADRAGAMEDLQRASDIAPEWGIPCITMAEQHLALNEVDSAWVQVEKARARQFDPGYFAFRVGHLQRNVDLFAGRILLHRGEREAAILPLSRALERDSQDVVLRLELGQALVDVQRYRQAIEVLEPAGENEAALPHFVQLASALGLSRVLTGNEEGGLACLAPLLDVFAEELDGAEDVGPMELAGAMLRNGHGNAAKNMMTLFHQSMLSAA